MTEVKENVYKTRKREREREREILIPYYTVKKL